MKKNIPACFYQRESDYLKGNCHDCLRDCSLSWQKGVFEQKIGLLFQLQDYKDKQGKKKQHPTNNSDKEESRGIDIAMSY